MQFYRTIKKIGRSQPSKKGIDLCVVGSVICVTRMNVLLWQVFQSTVSAYKMCVKMNMKARKNGLQ